MSVVWCGGGGGGGGDGVCVCVCVKNVRAISHIPTVTSNIDTRTAHNYFSFILSCRHNHISFLLLFRNIYFFLIILLIDHYI